MKMLPPTFGPISNVFGDLPDNDKTSTGISVGYPILRIKGKVWSITRGGGDPFVLMRPDNDGPRNSIDVVLLASSQFVSKVWYEEGYEEGSNNPPDCFSANGIVPDPSSGLKQCETCGPCDQNKWGSRITPAGKKAKACNDCKRVAAVPLGDVRNEAFGGPMLLRIPAGSLADYAQYGDGMDARGYKYFTIGTRISFDPTEAYPKLVFEPIRPLNDDEAEAVMELRKSEIIKTILQEGTDHAQQPPEEKPKPKKEPEEQPVTPKVTPTKPKTTPKPPPPAEEPDEEEEAVAPPPKVAKTAPKKTALPPPPSPINGNGHAFGGGSEEEAPAPKAKVAKKKAEPPPPQEEEGEEEDAPKDFEDTLDQQIEDLMSR
jgi:hypothetical protein